jgi:hypothetical protein
MVDAPVVISRWRAGLWPALALVGIAYIVALALQGERAGGGVVWFEPKGFLADRESGDIHDALVSRGAVRLSFRRSDRGEWLNATNGQALTANATAKLEYAIKLLRVTAPERHIDPQEMAGTKPADFGLEQTGLGLAVSGPALPPFVIAFGALNPLGLSRYARIENHDGLWLLPKHVSDAWESVVELSP